MALSSNPRKLANAPIGSFIVAGYDNPLGYIQAISLVDANGDPVPPSNAEFAEDSTHNSGDTGNFILGVRRDSDTTPVNADGDYHAFIFDNAGNLKTIDKNPTIEKIDDQAAGTLGVLVGGKYQASPTTRHDGDYVLFLADANGRLVVKLDQALPAGSATIGHVGNTVNSSSLYNGTTLVTPKFKKIDLAASGDLIAAVTSTKLRIVSIFLTVAADTTLKFQSGATTDLTGAMTVKAGGGFVLGYNQCGYFETAAGEKLNLVMGTSVQVSGGITYVEI